MDPDVSPESLDAAPAGTPHGERRPDMLSAIFDATHAALALLDRDFSFVTVNEAYARACGVAAERLVGRCYFELFTSEPGVAVFERVRDTGEAWLAPELAFAPLADGAPPRHWNWKIAAVTSAHGTEALLISMLDVTEQVLARREAEAAQAMLRQLLAHVPEGITIVAGPPDFPVIANSAYGLELIGRDPAELAGIAAGGHHQAFGLYLDDGVTVPRPEQMPLWRAAHRGEQVRGEEWVIRRPNGDALHVLVNVEPVRDAAGTIIGAINCWREITERKRMEEALRESEERFRTMADGSPIMIWVTDADGRVAFVNAAYCAFFGITLDDVRERGWQALIHPDDAAAYLAAYEDAVRTRTPYHAQARVMRADGTWRWVESFGQPRFSASGELLGMVGSSPDITDPKAAEQTLRDADRHKDAFLAMVSHELRNPLGALHNHLYLLGQAEPRSALEQQAKAAIARQVAKLTRIVDDLLDVARVTTRKLHLRREPIELGRFVRELLEDQLPLFREHEVELATSITTREVWIDADPTRLAQIADNLLQNAVKFTPPHGRVEVSLRVFGDDVRLAVHDSGVGIAHDALANIFEPFAQGDATLAQRTAGLGLGLPLVRALVEAHGGRVEASSDGPGRGAAFIVHLPRAEAADRRPAPARVAVRATRALRILVIDDNEDITTSLRSIFELHGHAVDSAHRASEGIAKAVATEPEVVICDLDLPDLDGFEVARVLRERLRGALLVALSGHVQPGETARIAAAGFDEQLPKPIGAEQLLQVLARARRH